jgi:hypothetical protein
VWNIVVDGGSDEIDQLFMVVVVSVDMPVRIGV